MTSDYRLATPLAARLLGVALVGLGGLLVLVTASVGLLGLPWLVLTVGLALVVAGVLAVGLLLSRRAWMVRLDEVGYQVRFVRGAGVSRARWKDVEDVVATTVAGDRCVVLRLRDGRTTTVPVRALAVDADALVRDLQAHLNRGHGYRRIR